ncbi:hypothetical protein LTR85_007618 [Meristemomyces frigidus]|nr:hypothetical protein LTR85_007618 [Meristemomyces frigidus]
MVAAAKVEGIPELLEMILLQLPLPHILLAQRVNRAWRDLITQSSKLQRTLYFRPVSDTVLTFCGFKNVVLQCTGKDDCDLDAVESLGAKDFGDSGPNVNTVRGWVYNDGDNKVAVQPTLNPFLAQASSYIGAVWFWYYFGSKEGATGKVGSEDMRAFLARPGASWRRMLFAQPPLAAAIADHGSASHWHRVTAQAAALGMTLEDLHRNAIGFGGEIHKIAGIIGETAPSLHCTGAAILQMLGGAANWGYASELNMGASARGNLRHLLVDTMSAIGVAGEQVAQTPELVEMVLHYLPLADLLLAQRVDRTWRDIIQQSSKLQRALFFKPASEGGGLIPVEVVSIVVDCKEKKTCDLERRLSTWGPWTTAYEMRPRDPRWVRDPKDSSSRHYNPVINPLFDLVFPGFNCNLAANIKKPGAARSEASWRRMLLAQPPLREMVVDHGQAQHWHRVAAKDATVGLTFQDMYDNARAWKYRMGDISGLSWCKELGGYGIRRYKKVSAEMVLEALDNC